MGDERVGAPAVVSIVMPCCGQLEFTRLSVPRMLRHTRPPFEVLFVDAASLDGTADYLAGVTAVSPMRLEVIRGVKEGDFPHLVTQALARARGRYVAWVNNDVLVPELWLQQLLALATANEQFGLVGPMSNIAPGAQQVKQIPYRLRQPKAASVMEWGTETSLDTQPVDRFAQQHRQANLGQWSELDQVGGFCWLTTREVLGTVELLERNGDSVFHAGKYCGRNRSAGYRIGCCLDLFVHHFGSNLLVDTAPSLHTI